MSVSEQEKPFDLDLISISELTDILDSFFLDEQDSQISGEKFIVFILDEEFYAIPAKQVAEVVRPLSFTSLPNLPEWFLGIANLRGDIISIVGLKSLWNKESVDSPKSKLIVLRSFDNGSPVAFKIDKLREIVTLPKEEIEVARNKRNSHIFGKAEHKSNVLNLLDVEEILSSLKLI